MRDAEKYSVPVSHLFHICGQPQIKTSLYLTELCSCYIIQPISMETN